MNAKESARPDDGPIQTGRGRDKGGPPFPVADCTTGGNACQWKGGGRI